MTALNHPISKAQQNSANLTDKTDEIPFVSFVRPRVIENKTTLRNLMSDGKPRRGRPPGPSKGRGHKPWDRKNLIALLTVAANQDIYLYEIAKYLGMNSHAISLICCPPRASKFLEMVWAKSVLPKCLQKYVIKTNDGHQA